MIRERLVLEAGRTYLDRRGKPWRCVAVHGPGLVICVSRHGHGAIYNIHGGALASGALSWFDLVMEDTENGDD